ncbi:GATA transcription factor 15 [Oryza brachyantha]|uniref:GATA transcription factor 15 n=1 Tax=Oryza brachyantha TaxID=4533 RepID=UPI001ADB6393|nr:GATA transcription factor 15 [Oryza brachyantha]
MLHHYTSAGNHQDVAAGSPSAMASSTFSLFFPLPKGQWPPAAEEAYDDHSTVTTSPSSPSSSSTGSVDCTLSLGTPSSRRAEPVAAPAIFGAPPAAHCPSLPATVPWDTSAESYYCQQGKPAAGVAKCAVGHDTLIDRRCANCSTTSTPLWRNGPRGPKSLCNACGIRYKKEERRAAATADGNGAGSHGFTAHRARGSSAKAAPAVTCSEETSPYLGAGGDVADAPFLAWRLNVVPPAAAAATALSVWPERASIFHYN